MNLNIDKKHGVILDLKIGRKDKFNHVVVSAYINPVKETQFTILFPKSSSENLHLNDFSY